MIRHQQETKSVFGELADMLTAATPLTVAVAICYAGYHTIEWWNAPQAEPTMVEIEASLFWAGFYKWSLVGASIFFGCAITILVFISIKKYWIKSSYIMPDKNGNLPIVKDKYVTVDDFGHRHIYESWTDLSTGITTGMHKNGTVHLYGGAQTQQQAALIDREGARRRKAAEAALEAQKSLLGGTAPKGGKAPTVAQLRAKAGVFEAERSKVELQTQILEQKHASAQAKKSQAAQAEKVILTPIPGIEKAIQASKPNQWILGANEHKETCTFSPKQDGHLAIFGSNGSGKTKSTAQMAALYAIANGWNVIALDGKGGVDWLRFKKAGVMHAHTLDGSNIDYFIKCISQEMDRRYSILSRLDYESLHEAHDKKALLDMPKTLITFEELGASILDAPKPAETAKQLGILMRKLRATGIHLSLIEQSPDKNMLTNGVKANALYIVYNMPGHQAKVVNATGNVQNFGPGEFECKGISFKAWNVYEDRPLSGSIKWPDLFGTAPAEVASVIAKELPQGSDKLAQVIKYQIANPDASKAQVMEVCDVSDYTVSQARRAIKTL